MCRSCDIKTRCNLFFEKKKKTVNEESLREVFADGIQKEGIRTKIT